MSTTGKLLIRASHIIALLFIALALCACSTGVPAASSYSGGGSEQSKSESGTAADKSITLRYLDVGQGDATLIECDGHWMLIDGGKADKSSTVYSVLERLGVPKIDVIIATHPDADHIGGIAGALNYTSCDVAYCSTDVSDTKTFANMVNYLRKSSGIGITVPSVGDSFMLGGAEVEFLGPVRDFDSDNDNSLIVMVSYGSTSFLFTGDAEAEAESALVNSGEDLRADVLQVGHHGSNSSSSAKFLDAVSPEYSVVSVGENSYGHPTKGALNRLGDAGSTVLRTDERGDITFVSDGTDISYTTQR